MVPPLRPAAGAEPPALKYGNPPATTHESGAVGTSLAPGRSTSPRRWSPGSSAVALEAETALRGQEERPQVAELADGRGAVVDPEVLDGDAAPDLAPTHTRRRGG